jgi:hypothetical protein
MISMPEILLPGLNVASLAGLRALALRPAVLVRASKVDRSFAARAGAAEGRSDPSKTRLL